MLAMLLTAIALQGAPTPGSEDPLQVFSGEWQIVDTNTGETAQDCTQPQRFEVSADRRTVVLTEPSSKVPVAERYMVLRSGGHRVLMFIENEARLTEAGDPILWWANFEGPDRFRWRRYDWGAGKETAAQWRRCPSKK